MPHFLKRLELNGFKSFAQRTVLEFPAGITAIVGPNGSGKSNVVDAIRWLLGERDAKNLRGAKVEDLIFAGTAKRPRMGQAQAALHFDNASKFFPVEFAEVSVMRQIARDGASKYFLNKSEILLRDLVDFFAKARLGSRGLVVVTQGNSDVFIRATPQERREMIEEILGLREYQIKKFDAERRLKNSEINLDKAKALIEEILPHLRSLKRQTSRWEKRGALEDELKTLENQFFGSQFAEIREKITAVEKRTDGAKAEFTILDKARREAEARQERVELSQPEERKDLQKIKEQTQVLLERRGGLQKDLGRLEAQLEMAANNSEETRGHSSANLLGLVKRVRETLLSVLEGDMVELREGVHQVIEDIEEMLVGDKAKSPQTGIGGNLKAQFEKINGELKGLEGELQTLKTREKDLEKSQEEFYRLFKAAVAGVEAAKNAIEKWEVKNRENLFEKERLELRREEILRQLAQAGRSHKEFEGGMDYRVDALELPQIEKRIFKLRGDLASIGEVDEAMMKEAQETESRYEFLGNESSDLERAVADLRGLIAGLNEKIKTEFERSLHKINDEFNKFFGVMFGGGQAKLKVSSFGGSASHSGSEDPSGSRTTGGKSAGEDEADETAVAEEDAESEDEEGPEELGGVEIDIRLPRKKINSLEMLSGGERSLVGIAALFAMISVSPPPFLVLDEIDAALDDRNARRFAEMLKEFSKHTQFVVVTHNRATMEAANVLYGVTLNEDGTSKILSLKLES